LGLPMNGLFCPQWQVAMARNLLLGPSQPRVSSAVARDRARPLGPVRSRARGKGWRALARPAVAPAGEDGSPPARQNFPLNLPTNRRLCSTVGGRIVEGWTAHCCAVSTARSRAAIMTNLARSSLALVWPALFGAAKELRARQSLHASPRRAPVRSRQDDHHTTEVWSGWV